MACPCAAVYTFNVNTPATYVVHYTRATAERAILQVIQFNIFIFVIHNILLK
jgi:hypothetical protein